ncbi:MAG TPA: GPW/gp25 family protein [Polyangiaceae bacterium]|jgi:phage baseplate assembly protein W|nr:GPW/gp25 family protein [Polyangiaceae bacterium]
MFLSKHFLGTAENEIEDIQRNLGFVLSTKRGCGYFLESFGLSEMTFRTPEEAVTQLTRELEENIRLFEPRVELTKIDEEYEDDGKRVRLVATLRQRGTREALRLVIDLEKKSFSFEEPSTR